jgi:hypothetical protein
MRNSFDRIPLKASTLSGTARLVAEAASWLVQLVRQFPLSRRGLIMKVAARADSRNARGLVASSPAGSVTTFFVGTRPYTPGSRW